MAAGKIRKTRTYHNEAKKLLFRLYGVDTLSDLYRKIADEYQQVVLNKERSVVNGKERFIEPLGDRTYFESKLSYIFSEERPRDGKAADYISDFIHYMHPEFDYRFYSSVTYNHRVTDAITASMRTLMITAKMELYFQEECETNFEKFSEFYRHLHQVSDRDDHFITDIDDDPDETERSEEEEKANPFYTLTSDEHPFWEVKRGFVLPHICELFFKANIKRKTQEHKKASGGQDNDDSKRDEMSEDAQPSNLIQIYLGYAVVHEKTGNSRLVLDSRPFMWTGRPLELPSRDYYYVRIPGSGTFPEKAIEALEKRLAVEYGSNFRIKDFGGWPSSGDLRKFRAEYERRYKQYGSNEQVKQKAIIDAFEETLFAKVRRKMNITQLDVRVLAFDGNGLPTSVYVPSAPRP